MEPLTEPWALYPRLREQMIALATSLTDDDLDRIVPSTPDWTVRQVVAHVCGLNGHILTLGWGDLGSDEATAAQVAAHEGQSIGDVCAAWASHDDALRAALAEIPFGQQRLSGDLVIHLHDVLAALGRDIDRTDEATASAARIYASRSVDRWAELTGVSVRVELDDGFVAGDAADVVLRATPFDFLRSVAGRRSRAQVEALDWTGEAAPVVDRFSPYGDLGPVDAAC